MNIFKKKRTCICDKCGGKMVEQLGVSILSSDIYEKHLYKCKKCKTEIVK